MSQLYWFHKGKKGRQLLGYGVMLLFLGSCSQQVIQHPPIPSERSVTSEEYLIGPEDIVEVMVWKNPDLSRVVNVRPDGKISLPLIGDIKAAGNTTPQLQEEITERLRSYYKELPPVSVIVQQVNSYAIYVLGEVKSPGKYVVKSGTTFLQAIALAGGFSEFASTNKILVRSVDGRDYKGTIKNVNYKEVIAGKKDNVFLNPGDTIIIP
jgi:polysaccharide export outer membrane protein